MGDKDRLIDPSEDELFETNGHDAEAGITRPAVPAHSFSEQHVLTSGQFSINADISDSELDDICRRACNRPNPEHALLDPDEQNSAASNSGSENNSSECENEAAPENQPMPDQSEEGKAEWFCCFHVYRHHYDIVILVVNIVWFLLCVGQAVVVWLDNRRSHGWCVFKTAFHPGGIVDLRECALYSYLAFYSVLLSASIAVLSACVTWSLQLFANTRWLIIQSILILLALGLAVAAFVWTLVGFWHWCTHLENALGPVIFRADTSVGPIPEEFREVSMEESMKESSGTSHLSCHKSAMTFDKKYPQFVRMASTFDLTLILMVILVIHILVCLVVLVLSINRVFVAHKQILESKLPRRIAEQGMAEQDIAEQDIAEQGIPEQGFPWQGIPEQGFAEQGIPEQGFPWQGIPEQGFAEQGTPEQGFPEEGTPDQGTLDQGTPEYIQEDVKT